MGNVTLNKSDILSHIILEDTALDPMTKIASTPEWTECGELNMEIKVNGVPITVETFRKVMEHFYKAALNEVDVDGFQEKVMAEVERIIEERAAPVLDELDALRERLVESSKIIKYPWED